METSGCLPIHMPIHMPHAACPCSYRWVRNLWNKRAAIDCSKAQRELGLSFIPLERVRMGVVVWWCGGVLVCWCAGVLVWCAGVLVCAGPACLFVLLDHLPAQHGL